MIKDIKLFENIMNSNGENYTSLASKNNMTLSTLTNKVKRDAAFTFKESVNIANQLNMSNQEYIACFFN